MNLKKNWFWYVLGVILILVLIKQCETDPELKYKIKDLERQRDSIQNSINNKNAQIESLNKTLLVNGQKIDSLTKVKTDIKTTRDKIPNKVEKLSFNQLDSIINSHTKESVVKTLFDYPLVLDELSVTNKLVFDYKNQVSLLNEKDKLKDDIIKDKDNQIKIVESQRDLYKKESKPKSGLFIYADMPINTNLSNIEAGLLYQYKNTFLIKAGIQNNNLTSSADIIVGVGVRIF